MKNGDKNDDDITHYVHIPTVQTMGNVYNIKQKVMCKETVFSHLDWKHYFYFCTTFFKLFIF